MTCPFSPTPLSRRTFINRSESELSEEISGTRNRSDPAQHPTYPTGRFLGPELEFALYDQSLAGANVSSEIQKAVDDRRAHEHAQGGLPVSGPDLELHMSTVEYSAGRPVALNELWEMCQTIRLTAAHDAALADAFIASVGTPFGSPFLATGDWKITLNERYLQAARSWGAAKTQQIDLGAHLHISHQQPDTRVEVANRLSRWGPLIVALSANSPYDEFGHDTGWASWRTRRRRADPTNPVPIAESNFEETMKRFEENRKEMGLLYGDLTQVHPGVRVFGNYPTIEERRADVGATADDDLAIMAFIAALHDWEYRQVCAGAHFVDQSPDAYVNAMNLAAKSGLDAQFRDPITGIVQPITHVIRRMVFPGGQLHDFLVEQGVWDQLNDIYEAIIGPEMAPERRKGNGADRLRNRYLYIRRTLENDGKPVVPWIGFAIDAQLPLTQHEARALQIYAIVRSVVGGLSAESESRVSDVVKDYYQETLNHEELTAYLDTAAPGGVLALRPLQSLHTRSWDRAGLSEGVSPESL